MHRLCDSCGQLYDTNGEMELVDDDAYCIECYANEKEFDNEASENKTVDN
jgi:hypothetical protein